MPFGFVLESDVPSDVSKFAVLSSGVEAGDEAGGDPADDAGKDAGADAGDDAGAEGGGDAGDDAGDEAGAEAGDDAGDDAGAEAGGQLAETLLLHRVPVASCGSGRASFAEKCRLPACLQMLPVFRLIAPLPFAVVSCQRFVSASSTIRMCTVALGVKPLPVSVKLPSPFALTLISGAPSDGVPCCSPGGAVEDATSSDDAPDGVGDDAEGGEDAGAEAGDDAPGLEDADDAGADPGVDAAGEEADAPLPPAAAGYVAGSTPNVLAM